MSFIKSIFRKFFQEEIDSLREQLYNEFKKNKDLEEEKKGLNNYISDLQKRIKELNKKIDRLTDDNYYLNKSYNYMKSSCEKEIQKKEKIYATSVADREKYASTVDDLNKRHKQEINNLQKQKQSEILKFESKIVQLEEKKRELGLELQSLKKEIKEDKKNITKFSHELINIKEHNQNLSGINDKLEKENNNLKKEIKEYKKTINQNKEQIEKLQKQKVNNDEELKKTSLKHQKALNKISELNKIIKTKDKEIDNFRSSSNLSLKTTKKDKNKVNDEGIIIKDKIIEQDIPEISLEGTIKLESPLNQLYFSLKEDKKESKKKRSNNLELIPSGIKLEEYGQLNLGKRSKRTDQNKELNFKFIGKTQYRYFKIEDIESFNYPTIFKPVFGTPIINYIKNCSSTMGIVEPILYSSLKQLEKIEPELCILKDIGIPIQNRPYMYKPDLAIIWPSKDIYIDIEIDEPYDIVSRKPIHYKGCSDKLRNAYLIDNGWFVIRVTEQQIVEDLDNIVKYIKTWICILSEDLKFEDKFEKKFKDQWSFKDAQEWEKEYFRENYLGIEIDKTKEKIDENIEFEEFSGIYKDFVKPNEDIIIDRFEGIRNEIQHLSKQFKYIILNTADKNYDYVAEPENIKFSRHDLDFGIEFFECIEEKEYFLPYKEIYSCKGIDSLYKMEVDSSEDWEEFMFDAILNCNPVEIEYKKRGALETTRRKVLYPTLWFNFFDEGNNREKYTIEQLLTQGAKDKYLALADNPKVGYFTGYCLNRKDIRTFYVKRIERGKIFNFRKNLYHLNVPDIWNVLQLGAYNVATIMYDSLNELEKNDLFHLGNYANALVLKGDIQEAIEIYLSINRDTMMPHHNITWKESCIGDMEHFIEKEISKENFEKVREILKERGW